MCGIVAYIGRRQALPVLLEGLKRLEYRGYDSAGLAILDGGLKSARAVGRVSVLEGVVEKQGTGKLFGPGTPTSAAIDYIRTWFADQEVA